MPALVRTPIQHDLKVTRNPFLKTFHNLASQMQDYKSMPHSQPVTLQAFVCNIQKSLPAAMDSTFCIVSARIAHYGDMFFTCFHQIDLSSQNLE